MTLTGRTAIMSEIESSGLVAIIRADGGEVGPQRLVDTCKALRDGGVRVSEITMTSPGALDAIAKASDELAGECIIGVGSVLDAETARAAILAGAQFVVAPTFNAEVLTMAHRYDKPVAPGALTPTEIMTAWESGADVVKIFPANHFGPRYFKDVLAPMPQVKLMPTGGVNLDTAADWLAAGAAALGAGSALVKKDLIAAGDWAALAALAREFVEKVQLARS